MVKIVINYDECGGDGECLCIEICPVEVFKADEATERPVVANEQNCILCRTCEFNCPSQAIKVKPETQTRLTDCM